MSYHPCVSGCGHFLAPQDGHDRCLTCLGIQHAEEAFVDGSCSSCGEITIPELRNRLPLPRSGVRPGTRGAAASGGVRGDLRITVRASPRGVPHPSSTPQPVGLPFGAGWDLCRAGYTTRLLRCSPWRPDVDRCIGGWALSLRGWRLGCVAPFGCGSAVRARPRDDDYAFPGRRECWARVESSTASRSFEAGRVVSRWGRAGSLRGTCSLRERVCASSTTSMTGSYLHSLANSCAHTGTWCSGTSASWAFGSTGKRANSCQRRGSLLSAWSWIRSTRQHASPRNVLSRCWTASRLYQAGRRSHWNSFRGSWGIWLQLRW